MSFHGQFQFKNGLVIPNNITTFGIQSILNMAFLDTNLDLWVGLCSAIYDPALQIENITEPTIGVNGYARQQITRDATGWPGAGTTNLQPYIESADLVWLPVGGAFDQAISRMFLCASENAVTGDVFAISGTLNEEVTWDPDTLEEDRTLKYRIYSR